MNKLIAIIVLIVTFFGAFSVWYLRALSPVDPDNQTRVTIKIEQGMSVDKIAGLLEERGLIRSSAAFKIFTKLSDMDGSLQAGSFVIKTSLSAREVALILTTGKAEEMIFTIPEGFTVKDIDTLLSEKGLIEEGEFTKCAQTCDLSEFDFLPDSSDLAERGGQVEGYLYPDTYFVIATDFTAEAFLQRLLRTFERRIIDGLADYLDSSGRSLNDIVNMASLIEEEANKDKQRVVIAGILWKRYDAGMGLGVDATVRYILNKPRADITIADLNTNNPYNTRKFRGLPTGPIANPGYDSILASMKPQKSEYWYYLHDDGGDIHYAKTNEEHNINRNTYLR